MAKKAVIEFVQRLIGIFSPTYVPEPKVQTALVTELSRHTLTPDQWERVVDVLKNRHVGTGLPHIGMIEQAIKEAKAPERVAYRVSHGGTLHYKRDNGYTYQQPTRLESGRWVIVNILGRTPTTANMEISAWLATIPGAELITHVPNDPDLAYQGEKLTAEERAELSASFRRQMAAIEAKKVSESEPQGDGKYIAMESKQRGRAA